MKLSSPNRLYDFCENLPKAKKATERCKPTLDSLHRAEGLVDEQSSLGVICNEISHFSKQLKCIALDLSLGSGLRKPMCAFSQPITCISAASECKVVGLVLICT